MNDGITVSTFEFLREFPNQESARVYLEDQRWGGNVVCPHCDSDKITIRRGPRLGYYRCRTCKKEFTVRTGSVFERSHVSLDKWLYAIYLIVTARKGISSLQLSKELSVTQRTAWFMLGRLREACGGDLDKLKGIVEVDETFVRGKERNKHASKRLRAGRGTVGKATVAGARQRKGKVRAKPVSGTDTAALQGFVSEMVEPGSTVFTDDHRAYKGMAGYKHSSVNHSSGEYVRGGVVHTNGVESVWAVLKRSIYGTWHHVSPKHLARYVNETTFRLNEGNCRVHTLERVNAFVQNAFQHRITYRELTA